MAARRRHRAGTPVVVVVVGGSANANVHLEVARKTATTAVMTAT